MQCQYFEFDSYYQLNRSERFIRDTMTGNMLVALWLVFALVALVFGYFAREEQDAMDTAKALSGPVIIADLAWNWIGDVEITTTNGDKILLPGHSYLASSMYSKMWSESRKEFMDQYIGSVVFLHYTNDPQIRPELISTNRIHWDTVGTYLSANLATCTVRAK